eukprot:scaffold40459_cov37-Tisochrysis_lutea.AAC.1
MRKRKVRIEEKHQRKAVETPDNTPHTHLAHIRCQGPRGDAACKAGSEEAECRIRDRLLTLCGYNDND